MAQRRNTKYDIISVDIREKCYSTNNEKSRTVRPFISKNENVTIAVYSIEKEYK